MLEITDEIITKAAQGDIESFELIYRCYSGFVYNVAYRVAGNPEDAQEITQDVFVIIHKKLGGFRFASALKTWLYRVTMNTSINYVKKAGRERGKTLEFKEEITMAQPSTDKETIVEGESNEQVIESLLHSLNADQRACLVLRSVEGLSYQEIATALNVNINTVRTRIKRGREALLALKKEVIKNAV